MRVSSTSPLGKTGLQAAIDHMRSKLRKPLDERFVEFSLDAVNAALHVQSLERSATGEYGRYAGSAVLTYEKVALETVVPSAIIYTGQYPILFVQFAGWFLQTYGIVLEQNEFAIDGGPTTPLVNNTMMTFSPDSTTGYLSLRALNTSGRFIAGSKLHIRMEPSNGPAWLQGLVPSFVQGDLSKLAYST